MSENEKTKLEKGTELAKKLSGRDPADWVMPEKFKRITLEHLFGDIWQGEELEIQERSLLTCAVLTALGRESEQLIHFNGAKNLGVDREKMTEMITHVAHYAGWPVAVSALRVLGKVWDSPETEKVSE